MTLLPDRPGLQSLVLLSGALVGVLGALAAPAEQAVWRAPRFEKPQAIMHRAASDVGPICVPAIWPQVQILDWDHDGLDDVLVSQGAEVADLLFRNLNRWHNGAPVFDAPQRVGVGPGAHGCLVSQDRLEWIGVLQGKGAYQRRGLRRTASGYTLGELLPLLEASAGQPLQPPLASAVEPSLRIADLNGDGRQDLLVGIRMTGYASPLSIDPPGGWDWPTSFGRGGTWLGNDSLGLVAWHKNVGPADNPRFTVGKPLYFQPAHLPLFTHDDAACDLADLDGDAQQELIVCTFDRLVWFDIHGKKGEVELGPPHLLPVGGKGRLPFERLGVDATDLDKDGLVDMVLYGPCYLYFARNVGAASEPKFDRLVEMLQTAPPVSADGFAVPAVADLNGDGHPDLVVGTEDGRIRYFENAGHPLAEAPAGARIPAFEGSSYAKELADPAIAPLSFKAGVYLEADGQIIDIDTPITLTGPLEELWGYTGPVPCDWDGDGDLDIVTGCVGPFMMFYENIGSSAQPILKYQGGFPTKRPGGHYQMAEFYDFNGDGLLDAIAGSDHGWIYYFRQLAQ